MAHPLCVGPRRSHEFSAGGEAGAGGAPAPSSDAPPADAAGDPVLEASNDKALAIRGIRKSWTALELLRVQYCGCNKGRDCNASVMPPELYEDNFVGAASLELLLGALAPSLQPP